MEKIKEYAVTHFCMTSLNAGEVSLDDEIEVLATAGEHMNYEYWTTIEAYLIETLMPFASTVSQLNEAEWQKEWEMSGADSGYSEYVPTPIEKFNWQEVPSMALQLGVSELILREFLVTWCNGMDLHDFTIEWEDETDEHCSTFLLVSPE